MLPINSSSGVKQISALSKSVGAKEENRPATHEGKRGEEAAALTAAAQGARSRLPALTDGKRAPSAKAPEGSRDTAPCRDTEPPHTVRPFPDPAGQQSRRSRCLHLQTCRHTPDENGKRLPQRPVTPTPARAQGQRGHQTPSDTKRQEIQTSTCLSRSQRFIYKNGREESGCPPSLPGGGVCSAPCSAFLFQQFLQSQSPPFGMVLVHSKPGAGEREGPGQRARTAFPERAVVVPHAPATPAPDPHTRRRWAREPGSPPGSEGHALTTPRRWIGAARRTLGHDPEDGVVAADAGAVLLVVLLGVTHLEELRLGATSGRGTSTLQVGRRARNLPPVPPRRETPLPAPAASSPRRPAVPAPSRAWTTKRGFISLF